MSLYAAQHARALATARKKGAAVTLTSTSLSYDPETDVSTPTDTEMTGYAFQMAMNPMERAFADQGVTLSIRPRLLFVPTTYGDTPATSSTLTWGGETVKVSGVSPIAPDGTTIMAELTVEG